MIERTKVIFLLDSSGSMLSKKGDVLGGFQGYVKGLRTSGQSYEFGLFIFADRILRIPLPEKDDHRADYLTEENYQPAGNTALYDAIGEALNWAKLEYGSPLMPEGDGKFILVIMTDGEENASRHYTKEMINQLIEQRKAAGNWTFAYLGADQDAWVAAPVAIPRNNTLSFSGQEYGKTFERLARATNTASISPAMSNEGFFCVDLRLDSESGTGRKE